MTEQRKRSPGDVVLPPGGTARDTSRQRVSLRNLAGRVGLLFPRNARSEAVETARHFEATPEAVWQSLLFYEEVPLL